MARIARKPPYESGFLGLDDPDIQKASKLSFKTDGTAARYVFKTKDELVCVIKW